MAHLSLQFPDTEDMETKGRVLVQPIRKAVMSVRGELIMFWGRECPHCHAMMPFVDKLEKEEKTKFERLEVWHDAKNAERMRKLAGVIKDACGGELGTPAFYNESTKKALCGEVDYETLKEWALMGVAAKKKSRGVTKERKWAKG